VITDLLLVACLLISTVALLRGVALTLKTGRANHTGVLLFLFTWVVYAYVR
jgi:hypothetical protein